MGDFDETAPGFAPPPPPPPPPPSLGGQPTYLNYGASQIGPIGIFVSAKALAVATQFFLAADAVFLIILAVERIQDRTQLNRVFTRSGSTLEMRGTVSGSSSVGGLLVLTILGTIIVFIMWFYRSRKNADALGDKVEYSPGMAIGGWFIPFVNYVFPIQIAIGMWSPRTQANRKSKLVPGLWWATFAVGPWVAIYGQGLMAFSILDSILNERPNRYWRDRWARGSIISALGELVLAASVLLAIALVRGITKAHDNRFAAATSGGVAAF